MPAPILMISYEAPPRLSAESILVGKTLRSMTTVTVPGVAAGPNQHPIIDLVCASPGGEVPADEGLEELYPETLQVHHIDPVPQGRKTILQMIIGGKGGWQNAVVSRSAALFPAEHKKPALLYSRSHPPASHLAALDLINEPLKGVPWVAHFSDPWSQHPYYKSPVTRAALRRYEWQVFQAATRLVFVSEMLRDTMMRKPATMGAETHAALKAKARVIPHAFDPSLYSKAQVPEALKSSPPGPKKIAHIGDLYGLRSPQALFEGFARFRQNAPAVCGNAVLWLVGRLEEQFKGLDEQAGIAQQIMHCAPVPYYQSLAVAAAADVLLTIEAPVKNSVFFPSKLVDYLGARKPLLAITPKNSLVSKLMEQWGQPWCDVNDVDGIARNLQRIAEGNLWAAPSEAVLNAYSAAATAQQLAAVFAEVLQEKPSA